MLRVLLLENGRSDAEHVAARLSEGGIHCDVVRVRSDGAFGAALEEGGVDVILADHALPGSGDLSARRLAKEVRPGVPFIVTSGALDEELAKEALASGEADYVPKPHLERLLPAIRRATIGAEEAPPEDEAYLTMFESASVGQARVDLNTGRFLRANARLCRITGYSERELLRTTLADLANSEGRGESFGRFLGLTRGESTEYSGEERWVRKDGQVIWVGIDAALVRGTSGRPWGVVATVQDITERKRVEEELVHLASFPNLIVETGVGYDTTFVNPAAQERFSSLLEAGGNHPVLADLPALERGIRESGSQPIVSEVWVDDVLSQRLIVAIPGSDLVRLYVSDVTEHRWAETALKKSEERLRSLVRYDSDIIIIRSLTGQAAGALENAHLYEALGNRERVLQDFLKKLLGAQEEERRRVAYEVHDGLAQVAVAAHQNLQAFARRHPPESEKGRKELDTILMQVRATVSDARKVIANLRPTALDDLGLAAATSLEVERLSEEGYRVNYEQHLENERLPPEIEITLYRVAQEALTNMQEHAGTRLVRIELQWREDKVYLNVRDFGCGFDPAALAIRGSGPGERVGFAGMRERVAMLGGELEVESHPSAGTLMTASIPLARTA